MTALTTVQAPATLEATAHAQTEVLYDVAALIAAVADRIELAASISKQDSAHHTLRMLTMAREKVDASIAAFDPFI